MSSRSLRVSRVAVLSSFDLTVAIEMVEAGRLPRHHLWGSDALQAVGLHSTPLRGMSWTQSRGVRLAAARHFGDLPREVGVVIRPGRFAAVLSLDEDSSRGLALLPRRARPPLATILHKAPAGKAAGRVVAGSDAVLALSPAIAAQANLSPDRHCGWGPDLDFGGYHPRGESAGVVSAGQVNRDVRLLLAALADTGWSGTVWAEPEARLAEPGGVTVRRFGQTPGVAGQFGLDNVIAELQSAAVIAIPITDPVRLSGLTELNDALALGKPVVMTRTPHLPFDLDAEGVGITVAPGDRSGWREALSRLADGPTRAAMGGRAREFAEKSYNYRLFSDRVCALMTELVEGRP